MINSFCKCSHEKQDHLVGYGDIHGGVCWACYQGNGRSTYGINIVCGIFIKDNLRLLEILDKQKNG
jgi:hypothetical protein